MDKYYISRDKNDIGFNIEIAGKKYLSEVVFCECKNPLNILSVIDQLDSYDDKILLECECECSNAGCKNTYEYNIICKKI